MIVSIIFVPDNSPEKKLFVIHPRGNPCRRQHCGNHFFPDNSPEKNSLSILGVTLVGVSIMAIIFSRQLAKIRQNSLLSILGVTLVGVSILSYHFLPRQLDENIFLARWICDNVSGLLFLARTCESREVGRPTVRDIKITL